MRNFKQITEKLERLKRVKEEAVEACGETFHSIESIDAWISALEWVLQDTFTEQIQGNSK